MSNKEYLDDLYNLLNSLEDDLELDLKEGENGYGSYKDSYKAVKKFTLKILNNKIKKWENKKESKLQAKKDTMEEAMKKALGDIE